MEQPAWNKGVEAGFDAGTGQETDTVATNGHNDSVQLISNVPASFEIEVFEETLTGKWFHAAFHTVTAVVGAGVLGLPYAFSWLGWAGGIISLTVACVVSLYTSYQLASLHALGGKRHNRYRDLGRAVFGERFGVWAVAPFQFSVMTGLAITYTVTAGQSFKGIASAHCYDQPDDCNGGLTAWIILFGVIVWIICQLPKFHSLWWTSMLGAIMSTGYSLIAFMASAVEDSPTPSYNRTGISTADRIFGAFNALGAITFAYGGHSVLLEIQATLATPPAAKTTMMKGVYVAYSVVVVAYYTVSVSGFLRYGVEVNELILLSIKHPVWLIDVANFMVVVHVAASYPVYCMPIFEALETNLPKRFESCKSHPIFTRIFVRTAYVIFTTFVACMLPFFADLMGLIGAIGFLPMTFVVPAIMWITVHKELPKWEWGINVGIIGIFTLVAVISFVGSFRQIAIHAYEYHVFS